MVNLYHFRHDLNANKSKWKRSNWSDLFQRRVLSNNWILLVANPGEEAAPALLPLLPHLPPSVAAGVVEGKEEAAKEVREDGRSATHHQEFDAGREFDHQDDQEGASDGPGRDSAVASGLVTFACTESTNATKMRYRLHFRGRGRAQ